MSFLQLFEAMSSQWWKSLKSIGVDNAPSNPLGNTAQDLPVLMDDGSAKE